MGARILHGSGLFAAALIAVTTSVMAEPLPRNALRTRIAPESVPQSALAAQPIVDSSYHPVDEHPAHDLFRDTSRQPDHIPNACTQKSGSLCFDYRTGHAVYKPMRRLLPAIPGMTPHNLSIRRNRIVAEYRFK